MVVLGIETSTPVCSVALAEEDRVLAAYSLNLGIHHSERLLPMVQRILADKGLEVSELDGVAVASGPGSFTGVRIGMSTAKGLCLAAGLPLLAVPTLEGLAFRALSSDLPVCPMMDARREEVYAGVYRREGQTLVSLTEDGVGPLGQWLSRLPQPVLLTGDGAWIYREQIGKCLGQAAHFTPFPFAGTDAAAIAILGAIRLKNGQVEDLDAVEPRYLRRSQAERVRDERLAARTAAHCL